MDSIEKVAFLRSRVFLLMDLGRVEDFLDHLVSDEIVTVEEERTIIGNHGNDRDRARALWHILHDSKNRKTFLCICEALDKCELEHLRIKLIEEKEKLVSNFAQQDGEIINIQPTAVPDYAANSDAVDVKNGRSQSVLTNARALLPKCTIAKLLEEGTRGSVNRLIHVNILKRDASIMTYQSVKGTVQMFHLVVADNSGATILKCYMPDKFDMLRPQKSWLLEVNHRGGQTTIRGKVMAAMFKGISSNISSQAPDLPAFPDKQPHHTMQTIRGRIIQVGDPRIWKVQNKPIAVCFMRLKNQHGCFKMMLWGDCALMIFEPDQMIEVTQVRPDVYDNVVRMTSTIGSSCKIIEDDTDLRDVVINPEDKDDVDKDLKDCDETDLLSGMIIAQDFVHVYKCCTAKRCLKKKLVKEKGGYRCLKCQAVVDEEQVGYHTYARIAVECIEKENPLYLSIFQNEIDQMRILSCMEPVDYKDKKDVECTIKALYGANMKFRLNSYGDSIERIYTRKRPIIQ